MIFIVPICDIVVPLTLYYYKFTSNPQPEHHPNNSSSSPSEERNMAKKLYGSPISTATQRALVCLYEKEIDFEFVVVDMRGGEHKKEHFLAKNPFGQVPVFEDGDITLFESRAIAQHLVHGCGGKGNNLIFPGDEKKMATLATWIEVESQKFDPQASKLAFQLVFKSMFGMGPPDESVVSGLEAELSKVLDVYDARLAHLKYLVGDEFSLADLLHLPVLHVLMNSDAKKLIECRPNVHKWAADILARPSWCKVLELQKN